MAAHASDRTKAAPVLNWPLPSGSVAMLGKAAIGEAAMRYDTDFKSIRDEVSPQEWQTRLDLAACYRLVDTCGMTDLIYNHTTACVPGTEDHLLINLYGLLYKEITASSLVKIDHEGNIIWNRVANR
jgi:class II aldolase/adducin N-terminal domain-containing protein